MRRRSLMAIEQDLAKKLRIWHPSRSTLLIGAALRDAQVNGIRMASEVAVDYDRYNSHPYLVSECILGKLNVLRRKPRKNPHADTINNAVSRLEEKVESVETTMRFLVRVYKMPTPGDRMWRLRPDELRALKGAVSFLRKQKARHTGAHRAVDFIDALIRAQRKTDPCGSSAKR
jgi:hypothetical protein